MTKHLLASLALVTACTSAARTTTSSTPQPATVPVATYTLLPISLEGTYTQESGMSENMLVGGTLALHASEATVELTTASTVTRSCSESAGTRLPLSSPTCAPTRSTRTRTLRGTASSNGIGYTLSLRDHEDSLELRCADSFLGVRCTPIRTTLFAWMRDKPFVFAFVSPGSKRFALTPVDGDVVGRVNGALSLAPTGAATFELSIDGEPTQMAATTTFYMQGARLESRDHAISAWCIGVGEGDRLRCFLAIDRHVNGQHQEIRGQVSASPGAAS